MSGQPNPESVHRFKNHVKQYDRVTRRIGEIYRQTKALEVELRNLEGEQARSRASMFSEMLAMGVFPSGNFGWENRFLQFATMLFSDETGQEDGFKKPMSYAGASL